MRKGKDPEPDADPYLWLIDLKPDLGGSKTCRSGSGFGSPTLLTGIITITKTISVQITGDCIGLDVLVLLGHLETETAVRTVPELERQESGESQEARSQQLPDYTDQDQVIKYIREAEAIKKANNQVRNTAPLLLPSSPVSLMFLSLFTDVGLLSAMWCHYVLNTAFFSFRVSQSYFLMPRYHTYFALFSCYTSF
jgi:hypothetical protein